MAVSVSWWACRFGKAKLKVPRTPPVERVGDRIRWLRLDPRALREWMLLPLTISLGSDIAQVVGVDKSLSLPVRKEVGNKKDAL